MCIKNNVHFCAEGNMSEDIRHGAASDSQVLDET